MTKKHFFTGLILIMLVFGSFLGASVAEGAPFYVPWFWGMAGGATAGFYYFREKGKLDD